MRLFILCILLNLSWLPCLTQTLIHAHNDYQKTVPLKNALQHKVFSIEADIYLSGEKLLVAHDKKDLATAKSLDSLYLLPIVDLFHRHKGRISEDSNYAPVLMIDIKENGEAALAHLIKWVSAHGSVFDRSINKKAVQLVISGDRGSPHKWTSYPSFILFDGRPYEVYDSITLKRVAFISDSWVSYNLSASNDHQRLKDVIKKVHSAGKLLRIWGTPDNPESWKLQQQLGLDIINTDKVDECRNHFLNHKR